jgi:hypothetical protein
VSLSLAFSFVFILVPTGTEMAEAVHGDQGNEDAVSEGNE